MTNYTMQEKLDALSAFTAVIPANLININKEYIINTLSLEEVLSNEFEEIFLMKIKPFKEFRESYSYKPSFDYNDALSAVFAAAGLGYFRSFVRTKKLDTQDIKKIYDKYIDKLKKMTRPLYDYNASLSYDSFLLGHNDNAELEFYLFEQILDNHLLYRFSVNYSNKLIREVANRAMLVGSSDLINKIITEFSKDNSFKATYQNFPLVIMNDNLSEKEKISIIKKTYKQKDLHLYADYIGKNITNLNHLDSFIEATVLQNNRVTKKEDVIFDLIKRVFFGIRGNSSDIHYEKLKNIDPFIDKYGKYLKPEKINDLVERSSWSLRNRIDRFFEKMYNKKSFVEKLSLLVELKNIGGDLISGKTDIPSEIVGNPDLELKYFKLLSKENKFYTWVNCHTDTAISYINKFPKVFADFANASLTLENITSFWFEEKEKCRTLLHRFIKEGNEEFLSLFKFLDPTMFEYLGVITTNSYSYDYYVANNAHNFVRVMLPEILEFSQVSEKHKDYIYNNYFSKLENNVEAIFTNLSKVLNTNGVSKRLLEKFLVKTMDSLIDAYIDPFKNFIIKVFPEKEVLLNNLDQLKANLKIICAL